MKSGAIFGYFVVAALLVSVFFINTGISSTLLEQKNGWSFTTSTRDTSPRALVGSDTGYSLTAGQRLNVSWNSAPSGMGETHSMRFYLLNSSQIGGWEWVVEAFSQYERTNSGYLIKLDSWTTTVTCLINSTGTYYVIFVCDGIYAPMFYVPIVYVYSYAAYVSSPPLVSITPGSVAMDLGQSQLFTSTVSGGTSPYSYQWYLAVVILGNAVVNPGFETGSSAGWNNEGPNNPTIRSDEHHTGSYSCASPMPSGSYLPFKITQKLPSVLSSFVTNVSCWHKYGYASIDWLRVNYTDGSVSSISLGWSSDWTYVTLSLAANKTVDSLMLERTASYGNIICIDDVEFNVNGFPVSGATGSTWTYTPDSLGSYKVYVQVTDNAGFNVNSNIANVTVNSVPSVAILPSSVVMDVNQSQLFTSTVSEGSSPYSYQWYLNDSPVSGATSPTWTFTPSSSGSYNIYLNVTDNARVTVESNTASVTVSIAWKLTVSSAYDSPSPGIGMHTYNDGSSITCSVTSPVTEGGVTYFCTGWSGTGSVPSSGTGTSTGSFTITQDSNITWNWAIVQRKLTVNSAHDSPNPSVGDHLYNDGSSITCTVTSPVTEGSTVWTCTGWSGTGSVPASGSGTSVTFTISQDSTITWNWHAAALVHDVAVTNITSYKTVVGLGYGLNISVTVENHGNYTETVRLTVYANTTSVESQNVTLPDGNSINIIFTWNTTNFTYGNYTLSAYAWPVPEEVDVADNNCTCSVPIHVGVPGDVSSSTPGVYDKKCDMWDIAYLVSLFNTKPDSSNWNPNADVNNDGTVNMKDIAIAILNFNKHE